MRPCEQEWGKTKADEIVDLVEDLTGKACPCDRGLRCPLFPDLEIRQQDRQRPVAVVIGSLPAA